MPRLDQIDPATVDIEFEGMTIPARQGDCVATALLSAGQANFRETPVNGAPRGPYCMMGICFDCLVEIDGIANIQACMTEVRAGMRIRRQIGARDIQAQEPAPLGSS
jgi:predicted molibdopterin-dependent oxidoreductase YjgC